jgi:type III restriction enzyme
MKALNVSNEGRLSLFGPGGIDDVTLSEFRSKRRMQELVFDLARGLAQHYIAQGYCDIPPHALFPQLARIIAQYIDKKVHIQWPAHKKDLFLAPYYGWLVERLVEAIGPDTSQGEAPEVPIYESSRGPGSTAEVDFWTSREVREVVRSHVNYVVADTKKWEQSAAYYLDKHTAVAAFVKNAGLGFAIPYLYNGQMHDYPPDFLVRLRSDVPAHLILETKGFDPLADVKRAAAERWVAAVNAEGRFGHWQYGMARKMEDVPRIITEAADRHTRD